MKRILMMVFRNILLVPYMWCKLCYYASHVEKYTEKQRYDMLKFIVNELIEAGMYILMCMDRIIYRKKMDLCSSRTIKDCMMCWRL